MLQFKFIHNNINVSHLEDSISFYQKALNLHVVREKCASDHSYRIVYLEDGSSQYQLELTWLKNHPQKYDLGENEFHIALQVDDYEAAHEMHQQMGCIIFENPAMGIYFIVDPDGYWIEILPVKK